jgi:hypothetical protein
MRILNSCLIVALLAAVPALGQYKPAEMLVDPAKPADKPKTAPDSLESVIADAMKHNPDIRAAEAKMREAEIQLNKVKSEVLVAVTTQRELVKVAKETHQLTEEILTRKKQMRLENQLSYLELVASQIELQRSKAAVAELEATLHKLIGRVPGMNVPGTGVKTDPNWSNSDLYGHLPLNSNLSWPNDTRFLLEYANNKGTFAPFPMANIYSPVGPFTPAASNSNMMEKIRTALDGTIKIEKETNAPIQKILETMLKKDGDRNVPFRCLIKQEKADANVILMPGELPVGAWIVAIEDYLQDQPHIVRFYVREYGILVTTADRAPKDAIPVSEFWRRSKGVERPKEEKPKEEKK